MAQEIKRCIVADDWFDVLKFGLIEAFQDAVNAGMPMEIAKNELTIILSNASRYSIRINQEVITNGNDTQSTR